MGLDEYRRRRDFGVTPEPAGDAAPDRDDALSFVVQKHAASHLHFDFRLELDGVLKSWAVPKGPSLDPSVKRLAIQVEDHPLDYGGFEGIIPREQYGGGTVMLWDRGTWAPRGDPAGGLRSGRLKFTLAGERLSGGWNLVRTRRGGENGKEQWLLFKEDDGEARPEAEGAVTDEVDTSVVSGRTMDEIAAEKDAVWQSDRGGATADDRAGTAPANASRIPGARRAPFPESPAPELATLVSRVPQGDDWVHEIKYDGYRLLGMLREGNVRLLTRRGHDWTARFGPLAAALERLPVESAIIDGEAVVMDAHGASDFQMLQNALGPGPDGDLVYCAFDLLYLDGCDLRLAPLLERKAALRAVLDAAGGAAGRIRYSDHVVGQGPEFFRTACEWELEGIICKRADAPYRSRRTKDWLKVKCTRRQEFVVGGFTAPMGARAHFGALLLGVHDEHGALRYAGKVGTGFDERRLRDLKARMDALRRDDSPFRDHGRKGRRPRDVHWVEPELVCEVEFTEWTGDGQLRHPSFQGLREDKPAREVVRETPRATPRGTPSVPAAEAAPSVRESRGADGKPGRPPPTRARAPRRKPGGDTEVAGMRLSSPDRVLYDDLGLTKLELARYYERISEWALPHLRDRALTMVRCPQGQGKQCFYQKHADDAFPDEVRRIRLKEGGNADAVYTYVNSIQGVVALVQLGVLELHVWGSRVDRPDRPDRLVMDMDPGTGVPWARIVESALTVRERLEALGLESFVKTTGGKGLHVVAPLARRNSWDDVKAFARALAQDVSARHPGRYVTTSTLAKRRGKIYIDYLRNARGATSIAAYSVRAKPGAPVSVPIRWDELSPRLRPERFTPESVARRLRSLKADPWDGFGTVRQSITKAMRAELGLR